MFNLEAATRSPVYSEVSLFIIKERLGQAHNQVVRKLAAALAAGCSIIVKAPQEISRLALIRCFAGAGAASGLVNLVYARPVSEPAAQ
jgi:Aldehyde dehydrogenase family